jgi:hypothetical protein
MMSVSRVQTEDLVTSQHWISLYAFKILVGKLEGKGSYRYLGVAGRIILKVILRNPL